MKVREIPFVGRRRPKEITKQTNMSNLGWCGPIDFPLPVRINGVLCTHFTISNYGAIRFPQANNPKGVWHWITGDKQLPAGIDDTDNGWMIIPWGELIRITGCGVGVYVYEKDGNVIIEYKVKSSYNDNAYMYRVEFPVREPDIIRVFYYHCVSGYNTFVGIAKEPDNVIDWPLKENTPYMKKALEFDTSADEAELPEETKPFPPHRPDPIKPRPIVPGNPGEWVEVTSWKEGDTIYQVRKI